MQKIFCNRGSVILEPSFALANAPLLVKEVKKYLRVLSKILGSLGKCYSVRIENVRRSVNATIHTCLTLHIDDCNGGSDQARYLSKHVGLALP